MRVLASCVRFSHFETAFSELIFTLCFSLPPSISTLYPILPPPPKARILFILRRHGSHASHVADRGRRPEAGKHGPPLHRRLPRRQRCGSHPLRHPEGHRVSPVPYPRLYLPGVSGSAHSEISFEVPNLSKRTRGGFTENSNAWGSE